MEKQIWNVLFMLILLICSIKDILRKEICIQAALTGIVFGIVYRALYDRTDFIQIVYSCLPGFCIMGLSLLSEGKVGFGDGIVIWMAGLFYSVWGVLNWIFFAFVFCAFSGLILMLCGKGRRRMELPFIPFLTVSALFFLV